MDRFNPRPYKTKVKALDVCNILKKTCQFKKRIEILLFVSYMMWQIIQQTFPFLYGK